MSCYSCESETRSCRSSGNPELQANRPPGSGSCSKPPTCRHWCRFDFGFRTCHTADSLADPACKHRHQDTHSTRPTGRYWSRSASEPCSHHRRPHPPPRPGTHLTLRTGSTSTTGSSPGRWPSGSRNCHRPVPWIALDCIHQPRSIHSRHPTGNYPSRSGSGYHNSHRPESLPHRQNRPPDCRTRSNLTRHKNQCKCGPASRNCHRIAIRCSRGCSYQ